MEGNLLLLLLLLCLTAGCRQRFVYVVSDACMSSQLVTLKVLQRLEVTAAAALRNAQPEGVAAKRNAHMYTPSVLDF
jgi:hypothetical protein